MLKHLKYISGAFGPLELEQKQKKKQEAQTPGHIYVEWGFSAQWASFIYAVLEQAEQTGGNLLESFLAIHLSHFIRMILQSRSFRLYIIVIALFI